jgi:hypothetical protein
MSGIKIEPSTRLTILIYPSVSRAYRVLPVVLHRCRRAAQLRLLGPADLDMPDARDLGKPQLLIVFLRPLPCLGPSEHRAAPAHLPATGGSARAAG